jgi:hypothetical protein
MPAWLGLTLAAAFAVVAGYRVRRRDPAAALMAAGMAVMAVGMGGVGPHVVHGVWWALGFAVVALWPVVRDLGRPRELRPRLGRAVPYLVSGAAMVYMCTAGLAFAPPADGPAVVTAGFTAGEHDHSGHAALAAAQLGGGSLSVGLFALAGWLLACYYLLASVCAVTRRGADGEVRRSAPTAAEAVMGLGTMIMLAASV